MHKTTLSEWKILQNEEVKPYITYRIFESENSEFAFYFYEIGEWSLMKYASRLKIYKNKFNPDIIFQSKSIGFLYDIDDEYKYTYDWSGDKLVSLRQLISKGNNQYSFPFIVLNLSELNYFVIDDNSLNTLKLIDNNTIVGIKKEFDKKSGTERDMENIFNLDKMQWKSIAELK